MSRIIDAGDAVLRRIENILAYVGAAIIIVMMLTLLAEIGSRSLFNMPITGVLEMVEQMMVPIAALGIAYCQQKFGNIRMTLFLIRTSGRKRWLLECFSLLVATFVVSIYVHGSYAYLLRSYKLGGATAEIEFPLWISIGCVTVALAILLLRVVIQLLEAIRLVVSPTQQSRIFPAAEDIHLEEEGAI
ncbi:MAG: TRAP transporter small permease [Rhodobiaceae bacterium]|nr:TRAP transporter small permease [Rhodobiaceae bacterium]MCC0056620.1 TRAP transporter small permease [Rhodobiaceae bacterium]